ncbi:hypothetical protein KEM54_006809 [Ascosphaera aggregata]|nr:hypothetical protein KEM54_006809 [Ascosphaera aggregata]
MSSEKCFFDPYLTLGVPRTSTTAEIRTAYRRLVLKCHPDKVHDPDPAKKQDAVEQFQQVHRSYELLSNEAERAKYDDKLRIKEAREKMLAAGGKLFTRTSTNAGQQATTAATNCCPDATMRRKSEATSPQQARHQQTYAPEHPPAGPRPEPRSTHKGGAETFLHVHEERSAFRTDDPRRPPPSYEQVFARATASAAHATERADEDQERERERGRARARGRERDRDKERERADKNKASRRTSTQIEIDPSLADRVKVNGTSIRIDTPTPPPTETSGLPPSSTFSARSRSDRTRTSTSQRDKSWQHDREDPIAHATRLFEERVRSSEEKEAERKRERRRFKREQQAREQAAASAAAAGAEHLWARHHDQVCVDQQRSAAHQKLHALRKAAEEAAEDMRRTAERVREEENDRNRRRSKQRGAFHTLDESDEKERRRRAQRHLERLEREREKEREREALRERESERMRPEPYTVPDPSAAEELEYDNEKGTKVYEMFHHISTRRSHELEPTTPVAAAAGTSPDDTLRERPDLLRKLERGRERGKHEMHVRARERERERIRKLRSEEEYIHAWNQRTEYIHVNPVGNAFGDKVCEGILYSGDELRESAWDGSVLRSRTRAATPGAVPNLNENKYQQSRGTFLGTAGDRAPNDNLVHTHRCHSPQTRAKSRSEDCGRYKADDAERDRQSRRAETTGGRPLLDHKTRRGPVYLDTHTVSPERYAGCDGAEARSKPTSLPSAYPTASIMNCQTESSLASTLISRCNPSNGITTKLGLRPLLFTSDEKLQHRSNKVSSSPLRSTLRERNSIQIDPRLESSTCTSPSLTSPGTTSTTTTTSGTPLSPSNRQAEMQSSLKSSFTVKEKSKHFEFGMTALFEKASVPTVQSIPLDSIPRRRMRDLVQLETTSSRDKAKRSPTRNDKRKVNCDLNVSVAERHEIRYSKNSSITTPVSATLPVTENGDIKYTTAKNILTATAAAAAERATLSPSAPRKKKSSKSQSRRMKEDAAHGGAEELAHRYKASVY